MVRRSSDEPRTVPDTLAAQSARLDEAARAQGRGSTALRDASGNVLQMNGDAPYPLLRPLGVDGSMAFAPDGTVKIISPDTLQDRNMTVRDVASSGRVDAPRFTSGAVNLDGNGLNTIGVAASGTVGAARFACGPVNIDPAGIAAPGGNFGGTVGAARFTCGTINIDPGGIAAPGKGITTDPNGGMWSKDYWGGTFHGVLVAGSAPQVKRHVQDITDSALAATANLRWQRWNYDPAQVNVDGDDTYVGPMVDDMAENPLLAEIVRTGADGEPEGYDVASLVGVLGKAVAELAGQVADLRRQVEQRPTARYAWEPGWNPWG